MNTKKEKVFAKDKNMIFLKDEREKMSEIIALQDFYKKEKQCT